MNVSWELTRVVKDTSPDSLLGTYHAARHPVAARALRMRNTMAQVALRRTDERSKALGDIVADLLGTNDARKGLAAETSSLGVHYNLGESHPLLERRMSDLDQITAGGPSRVFTRCTMLSQCSSMFNEDFSKPQFDVEFGSEKNCVQPIEFLWRGVAGGMLYSYAATYNSRRATSIF